jgi:hypothetical protein
MVAWPMVATVQSKVERPTVVDADIDNIVAGYCDLHYGPYHDHHGGHRDRG